MKEVGQTNSDTHQKALLFDEIARVIEQNRPAVERILSAINSPRGSKWEIDQTVNTLKNMRATELHYLDRTKRLKNIAVYPSTNVALYNLVTSGIIPSTVAENVWFRTPQASRQVYAELYNLLKSKLSADVLNGLHILTEPEDVQYDKFRKMYVLGMDRRGKKIQRPPSEMVLFVGSPETLETIVSENTEKLRKTYPNGGYRQVVLGSGAGMTPSIISEGAIDNLNRAVENTIETIRMNSRQDCEAPDFYLVHKSVSKKYLAEVQRRTQTLKLGPGSDPTSDYTPLTMATSLSPLIEFRKKHQEYLLNPEARIDETSKEVEPHLFVFPFEMFKQIELEEHFAPFLIHFTYANTSQVEEAIRDPRVQRKALYGSISGPHFSSQEMENLNAILRQNRHGSAINTSIYDSSMTNMPFGGLGSNVSFLGMIDHPAGGIPHLSVAHQPILFSMEASRFFPKEGVSNRTTLGKKETYESDLKAIVDRAVLPPSPESPWAALSNPAGLRDTGLEYIKDVARREGLVIVVDEPSSSRDLEYELGAPVVLARSRNKKANQTGVHLHFGSIDNEPALHSKGRGRVNPLIGLQYFYREMRSKLAETTLANAVWPGIMPPTERLEKVLKTHTSFKELSSERLELKEQLNNLLKRNGPLSETEREDLTQALGKWLNQLNQAVQKVFPEGAYYKNYGDFATADMGIQITSFSSHMGRMAEEFMRKFEAVRMGSGLESIAQADFFAAMESDWATTGPRFVTKALTDPEQILVQGRMEIDRTPMGFNAEYRIDFLDGEPVLGRSRFSHEFEPEEIEKASEVVREFFKKCPKEFRHLAGGADVARLTDGRWVILEFNFGSNSGTLDSSYFPIESHQYISELLGKPTPFLKDLEEIHKAGLSAEKAYLAKLKVENMLFYRESFKDLSVADIGKHFRNLYLDEWSLNPTLEAAHETYNKVKQLFEDRIKPGNEEIEKLIEGAKFYLSAQLRKRGLSW